MDWLLILAGVALVAGLYLFDRPRPKPEPEVKEPARKKWVWETSYNPEVWFCEPCGKEYRVAAPPSVIPHNWMHYGRRHRPRVWECTRCRGWRFVYPVGWTEGDHWPPKGSWQ